MVKEAYCRNTKDQKSKLNGEFKCLNQLFIIQIENYRFLN